MNDKNFYIQAISDLAERYNDLSLLDLIYKVFSKSMGADDENLSQLYRGGRKRSSAACGAAEAHFRPFQGQEKHRYTTI